MNKQEDKILKKLTSMFDLAQLCEQLHEGEWVEIYLDARGDNSPIFSASLRKSEIRTTHYKNSDSEFKRVYYSIDPAGNVKYKYAEYAAK